MRQFGKAYSQFIEFNLDQASERRLFESNLSLKEMVRALFFEKGANINNSDTLLFIDEIQNSDRATALLRYLKEDFSELHVIAAGSMLRQPAPLFGLDNLAWMKHLLRCEPLGWINRVLQRVLCRRPFS